MHSCVQSFKKKKKSYYISTVFESRILGHKISCTDVLSEASCAVEKLHLGISFIRSSLHSLSFSPSSLSPSPSHTHLEHAFLFFFFPCPGKTGGIFQANYMGAFHLIYMSHISSGEAKVAKEEWCSAGARLSRQPIHPRTHGSYTSNRPEYWFRITSSLSLISFIMSWKAKTDPNSARWLGNIWYPSARLCTNTHTHTRARPRPVIVPH